jgi:hypothetical protein
MMAEATRNPMIGSMTVEVKVGRHNLSPEHCGKGALM